MTTADPAQLYERAQRRRSIVIAATSTTIAIVALVVLVPCAPGWGKVRQAFFDGDVFVESFPRLLGAFWLDVKILLWSTPLILVVALVVALARNARSPALFPRQGVRRRLHRRVPRNPGDPAGVPHRLRRARRSGLSREWANPRDLGHGHARAVVLGVRRRDHPRRHRRGPREPARGGAFARHVEPPDDERPWSSPRRSAASGHP